jgi:hypothetical protein
MTCSVPSPPSTPPAAPTFGIDNGRLRQLLLKILRKGTQLGCAFPEPFIIAATVEHCAQNDGRFNWLRWRKWIAVKVAEGASIFDCGSHVVLAQIVFMLGHFWECGKYRLVAACEPVVAAAEIGRCQFGAITTVTFLTSGFIQRLPLLNRCRRCAQTPNGGD